MKYSSLCKVYANLIINGRKTMDDVKEEHVVGTMVYLCGKEIMRKQISFKAVCGDETEMQKYPDNICNGYAAGNDEIKNDIVEYLESEGKGYLAEME